MEELREILLKILNEKLYQIILSNPRAREGAFKIKIRPLWLMGSFFFGFAPH